MLNTKPKHKKCVICSINFEPKRALQKCCGYDCSLKFAKITQEKAIEKMQRKAKLIGLEKLKTKSDWLKEVQKEFNKYIRLRDKGKGCISCGTISDVKYDAGHFYSVGAYPNLRFNEDNVHKQCSNNCNVHLSGNVHEYRTRLILKIGLKRFEELESQKNVKKHYSIEELKQLKEIYKEKIKQIQCK